MANLSDPLYLRIYNYLIDQINSEKITEQQRLPSEKELSDLFHVSRITSKKALEMLATDGLIVRIPGKGSFITKSEGRLRKSGFHKNKQQCIGVIIPDFSESYGIGLISGIEEECAKEGILNLTRRSHGDRKSEEAAIDDFLEFGVNGLIVMPVHGEYYNPKILQMILENFPLVIMDRQLAGINSSFVGSDNVKAAYNGMQYLFELKHHNICFLSPPFKNNMAISDRAQGIEQYYDKNGFPLDKSLWMNNITCTLPGHNEKTTIEADIQKIIEHIQSKQEITAVFAAEYNIAVLAQEALRISGKRMPEDVSILTFDSPRSFTGHYTFTHLRQRDGFIGQKAVQLIVSQMNGEAKSEKEKILVDTDLVLGNSTKEAV